MADAAAIDAKASSGQSILPLCGLPLAVKDAIDVVGYPTTAATPALKSKPAGGPFILIILIPEIPLSPVAPVVFLAQILQIYRELKKLTH